MKKLFLSLFVGLIGLISFGYCDNTIGYYGSIFVFRYGDTLFPINGNNCFSLFGYSCYQQFNAYDKDGNLVILSGVVLSDGHTFAYQDDIFCFNGTGRVYQFYDGGCRWQLHNISFPEVCPTCNPQYTSEECQSEYGLVTSGVLNQCNNNLLSCQSSLSGCQSSLSGRNNTLNNCSNNLLSCESSLASCIQSNCPIDTGDVMWSSLWINGIQHLGKPVINISIPDNIYWDYITNDEEFDLYVGSGYDQDYIDGIISINSYSPTSEDFTSIFVSGLTLIMPYIIFALFIVFLWKLIKRIFK